MMKYNLIVLLLLAGVAFAADTDYYSQCQVDSTSGVCINLDVCQSEGGMAAAGHCPGPSEIQCCTNLPHIYGSTDILGDKLSLIESTLLELESSKGVRVVFSIPDEGAAVNSKYLQSKYIEYHLGNGKDRNFNLLFVFDHLSGNKVLRGYFTCSHFGNIVKQIALKGTNKKLLDEGYTGTAFLGIANDIFNYIDRNSGNVTCANPEFLAFMVVT